jgi:phosphatidylglycerol---prolipoprotein diacylglyceryl transferase
MLFFRVMDGGMASHGGIVGVFFFTLWYARHHRISWTNLGDHLVIAAPLGLFIGRMANFINGELFGRAAEGVRWAVQFPTEIYHSHFMKHFPPNLLDYENFLYGNDYPNKAQVLNSSEIMAGAAHDPQFLAQLAQSLTPRHPSQIYEGILEGLLLSAILFTVRVKFKRLADGVLTGLFFTLYAIARIFAEQFREPDDGSQSILGLTKGQFYSSFMIFIGVAFFIYAAKFSPTEKNLSEQKEFPKP